MDATTHDGIDLYFHLQSIFIPRYMGCSSRQVFAHQAHSSVTSPLHALEDYSCVFLSSLIIDLQYIGPNGNKSKNRAELHNRFENLFLEF